MWNIKSSLAISVFEELKFHLWLKLSAIQITSVRSILVVFIDALNLLRRVLKSFRYKLKRFAIHGLKVIIVAVDTFKLVCYFDFCLTNSTRNCFGACVSRYTGAVFAFHFVFVLVISFSFQRAHSVFLNDLLHYVLFLCDSPVLLLKVT